MADSIEAMGGSLSRGSLVDVLDQTEGNWRAAVVTDLNMGYVRVQFTDSRCSESQLLPRDSSRLAPPASKLSYKVEDSQPRPASAVLASEGSSADPDNPRQGLMRGGLWQDAQVDRMPDNLPDFFLQPGWVLEVRANTHWYAAQVIFREPGRVFMSYKGWPLSHGEWISTTSDRIALPGTRYLGSRHWRAFQVGDIVQIGFRKCRDCFGASHWVQGTVVSLLRDTLIEVEWRERDQTKREWRDPLDEYLAPVGVPMPSVGDDGVVTMPQTIQGEVVVVPIQPTHDCVLRATHERQAEMERPEGCV